MAAYVNNVMIIRHELIARLVRMFQAGELESKINNLAVELYPKERQARGRCCIYKERAITRYKMLPLLGFEVPNDDIDLHQLSEYASLAMDRKQQPENILTVVDEACTGCVQANYVVTNLCRGCVASPCVMNCPKNAIRFTPTGQTEIKPEACVNCGLCQKACPYHAIIYMPIPCEEACPVGAIKKNASGKEEIDEDKCVYCGKCITACPFGAIFELSAVIDVMRAIERKEQVIAMVAPSILAQYAETPAQVFAAIEQIGFSEVVEVARGAEKTARHEAIELKEKLAEGQPFMTTSCCPSYVETVRKHVPGLEPYVSHTPSPLAYTAEELRAKYPNAKLVFVGPCVAKRKEARDQNSADFVLSFEELDSMLEGMDIQPAKMEGIAVESYTAESRGFAQSGGVLGAVVAEKQLESFKAETINGIDKAMIRTMKQMEKGKVSAQFYEVMACEGGCIAGPGANIKSAKAKKNFINSMKELSK
ncbi:monomeric [FeFe] hydrogenase [Mangrovibacterium diazotrophicum]|uniref:[FeFe] hydrogenase (Group B1/B3) n=1 Tax=Mangrovibacterium diazotrophicum TaxID=1261403 RepID=A0A419W825_9BACT|nr:monomeric [FeFe] hydrogenase [Mangrovibacterium diazotrophicum]RKD91595.1 [FeFe] hydrogenase (group B1/B3) [Mangrovibacterium diazotrophicum]